jgi:hypothetical protein
MLKGREMLVVCSWCRKEGKNEFLGAKVPFDDERETHGICVIHYRQVRTRWQEAGPAMGAPSPQTSRRKVLLSTLQHWTGLLRSTRN